MKIREGAYYRTRNGDVVGPMRPISNSSYWKWATVLSSWTAAGEFREDRGEEHDLDLISEVYVSDTPPADTPATEAKTLRDELVEKAALAILSGYYANPTLGPSKDPFGDVWDAAKEFVEARKK